MYAYAIQLHPADNIAVARQDCPAGSVWQGAQGTVTLQQDIPAGHKFALQPIASGALVLRYGALIGHATQPIQAGEWVHTHNLGVNPLVDEYPIQVVSSLPGSRSRDTFLGYPRPAGHAGTRNLVAVVSTVSCATSAVHAIARSFPPERLAAYPNVDGVIAVSHTSGCSLPPGSLALEHLQRTLANLLDHPNIAAWVLVGLGCEVLQAEAVCAGQVMLEEAAAERRSQVLIIQEQGGYHASVQAGIAAVETLLPVAERVTRQPVPLSHLCVALQCGGSDTWSGISANPLVGLVTDRLIAQGSTAVLAETPEIYGAAHLLTSRAGNLEAAQALLERVSWWEEHARLNDFSLDNNPSPGNKAGGLTTIYEKSLGAVAKGGSSPLMAVYRYGEKVTSPGLVFMDTPGNDPVSISGQVAGGCNLVLFTSGRGSTYGGGIAPCIKIASNQLLAERMAADMDYNAGVILSEASFATCAEELFALCLSVASGERTCAEQNGERMGEFVPWLPGAVL
jgi:altronate hydrolase